MNVPEGWLLDPDGDICKVLPGQGSRLLVVGPDTQWSAALKFKHTPGMYSAYNNKKREPLCEASTQESCMVIAALMNWEHKDERADP